MREGSAGTKPGAVGAQGARATVGRRGKAAALGGSMRAMSSLLAAWLLGAAGAVAQTDVPAGVQDPQRAWQNWALNCQGCHRIDGTGSDTTAPSLAGTVAKFLWVPGGREYLLRVPGVATSPLSDADLAEVMNWMFWRFDRQDLPASFRPFSAAELAPMRGRPLRLEASGMRSELLAKAEALGSPP